MEKDKESLSHSNGDVSITSCLRQNIGDRSFTESIEKV